jgi:hypothetical protein
MRFRFPRSAIFLMLLILFGVLYAIEEARNVSTTAGDLRIETDWPGLFALLVSVAAIFGAIALLGYGVLCALHQSGAQRFPNLRAWAGRK